MCPRCGTLNFIATSFPSLPCLVVTSSAHSPSQLSGVGSATVMFANHFSRRHFLFKLLHSSSAISCAGVVLFSMLVVTVASLRITPLSTQTIRSDYPLTWIPNRPCISVRASLSTPSRSFYEVCCLRCALWPWRYESHFFFFPRCPIYPWCLSFVFCLFVFLSFFFVFFFFSRCPG